MSQYAIHCGVLVAISSLFGCPAKQGEPAARSTAEIESVQMRLGPSSCEQLTDQSDPNETPYQRCPGLAGHSLIVRHVDSGRQSIEIVDDQTDRTFALNYHEVVTRHMFSIDPVVEWRVVANGGAKLPIALIVRLHAHENSDEPEQVTRSYLAVAKISPAEMCVTDRFVAGSRTRADLLASADSARTRPCLTAQPPLPADDVGPRG